MGLGMGEEKSSPPEQTAFFPENIFIIYKFINTVKILTFARAVTMLAVTKPDIAYFYQRR